MTGGVDIKLCNPAFIKQVFPRLYNPHCPGVAVESVKVEINCLNKQNIDCIGMPLTKFVHHPTGNYITRVLLIWIAGSE
jgi:hypothetical protein